MQLHALYLEDDIRILYDNHAVTSDITFKADLSISSPTLLEDF